MASPTRVLLVSITQDQPRHLTLFGVSSWNEVKANKVNQFTFPMPGDFEQVEYSEEARLTRQCGSDVGKSNQLDGIDLNLAVLYRISGTHAHALTGPKANGACDLSIADAIAKPFTKDHIA
jgi:hypothetical protein